MSLLAADYTAKLRGRSLKTSSIKGEGGLPKDDFTNKAYLVKGMTNAWGWGQKLMVSFMNGP